MTTVVTQFDSVTASIEVAAANTARSHLFMVNNDPNRMYVLQGEGVASSVNYTFYLDEGGTATITEANAEEAFQAIWAADGPLAATVTETLTTALSGTGEFSILEIIQQAAPRMGIEVPGAIYSSTVREHVEIRAIANEMAQTIGRAHRWRKLLQEATYTGNGTDETAELPADFGWMPDGEQVWGSDTRRPLYPVQSTDEWMGLTVQDFNLIHNGWMMFGGRMNFKPALASGVTARHFYQSTALVQTAAGANTSVFMADTDKFRIDDQLLKLAIIMKWKMDKGLPYADVQEDYEILKEKLIFRDKGAFMIKTGSPRFARGARVAFPGRIVS